MDPLGPLRVGRSLALRANQLQVIYREIIDFEADLTAAMAVRINTHAFPCTPNDIIFFDLFRSHPLDPHG
jgi:hypothetical protein